MRPPAAPTDDGMLNRLHAALADVPDGARPNFGRIARELRVSPTEVTVGVWQLVSLGRLDRLTLRPARPKRLIYAEPETPTRLERDRMCASLVWCGQCDRQVAFQKALGCRSSWCKAEIPQTLRECPL